MSRRHAKFVCPSWRDHLNDHFEHDPTVTQRTELAVRSISYDTPF